MIPRPVALVATMIGLFAGPTAYAATCPTPPRAAAPNHAKGPAPLFERVVVPGITDLADGSDSGVLADMNRDGKIDILIVNDGKPRSDKEKGGILNLFVNKGCWKFENHPLSIVDSGFTADALGTKMQIANLIDFNGDGFLDIFLSRNRGPVHGSSGGNNLLISQGAWDKFRDLAPKMGVTNDQAYNRQSSIADVDGDGWLDIAVAADNIGNTQRLGIPRQRFYLYLPALSAKFEDGHFEDISGTSLVPGFPGEFTCNPEVDRASPGITLRDLDNDGDLDLIQSYHIDMNMAKQTDPCASGEYYTGMFVWKNMLKEEGKFRFEQVKDNGLAETARSLWNPKTKAYEAQGKAISLPYVNTADFDNDGLLDVVVVGPTDLDWSVKTDRSAIKFWHNLGAMKFRAATKEAGLDPINWTYREWSKFFGVNLDVKDGLIHNKCPEFGTNYSVCKDFSRLDYTFYGADTVLEDFNNDGFVDIMVADRHELDGSWNDLRNVLFLNKGDGTFELQKPAMSGIDVNSISMEAADLDGDGLVDIVFFTDPGHSYPEGRYGLPPTPKERFYDFVFRNTGANGARANGWLSVTFVGITDARLVGTKVFAMDGDRILGRRDIFSNHSYKSGDALRAHFGLGKRHRADLVVKLPDGTEKRFTKVAGDRLVELNMTTGAIRTIQP